MDISTVVPSRFLQWWEIQATMTSTVHCLNVPTVVTMMVRWSATAVTTVKTAVPATHGSVKVVTITFQIPQVAVVTVRSVSHAVAACTVTAVMKAGMPMIGVPGVIAVKTVASVSTVITVETA